MPKAQLCPFFFKNMLGRKMHIPNKLAVNKKNTTVEEGIMKIYPLSLITRSYRNL